MISTTAEILKHNSRRSRIQIAPLKCAGCGKGCARQALVTVTIPGDYRSQVKITLTPGDQLVLLVNSLLLPLMGFIVGAGICDDMHLGEMGTVAGAVIGLSVGVVLCKKQSYTRFRISEVRISE